LTYGTTVLRLPSPVHRERVSRLVGTGEGITRSVGF